MCTSMNVEVPVQLILIFEIGTEIFLAKIRKNRSGRYHGVDCSKQESAY
jgi:hypothetical protein